MTKCLTDTELQAVADNEADATARAHAAECTTCRTRVDEISRELQMLGGLVDRLPEASAGLERRVRIAVATQGGSGGATTMRQGSANRVSGGGWRRRAWTSGLAAAALVVLAVFVIWPSVTRESRLSAAEILGRSLQTFSATRGVEKFVYQVQLEGIGAGAMLPNVTGGQSEPNGQDQTMLIQQVIDHDHAGRYRVTCYDANHIVRSMLAQDSAEGLRTGRFRVDDKTYYFKFTASPDRPSSQPLIALPDLQRAHLRALVSVMQSTSDQKLSTQQDVDGSYYAIQIPQVSADATASAADGSGSAPMFDLSEARALIHTGDFHLKELDARGTFFGQPFHLAFTLVQHDITGGPVDASMFAVTPQPSDIVLEGEATNDPGGDVILAALRALAKAQPQP